MSNATKMRRHIPLGAVIVYAGIFATVLIKNVVWSVGDQTDVIRAGLAAFPLGLIASFAYPGGRNGAFVAVSICAVINALAIYILARRFTGSAA
jgi:hypothetical protein